MTSLRPVVYYALAYFFCVVAVSSSLETDERRGRQQEVMKLQLGARRQHADRVRRASSFVRIGKSPASSSAFVPIMEDGLDDMSADIEGLIGGEDFHAKRASSFVRIGKSMSGERNLASSQEANESPLKRASSFVRIGRHQHPSLMTLSSPLSPSLRKSDDLSRKRMSSFVRIGKRLSSYDSADEPSNAGDEVVEIGKSSSVLSGGCDGSGDRCKIVSDVDSAAVPQGALPEKKASSFIRIGRSV